MALVLPVMIGGGLTVFPENREKHELQLTELSATAVAWYSRSIDRLRRDGRCSLVEQGEEPPRPGHVGTQGLDTPAEAAVGRYQRHLTTGVRRDGNEQIVTAARCMNDGDPA
jgi:hypothetical protein